MEEILEKLETMSQKIEQQARVIELLSKQIAKGPNILLNTKQACEMLGGIDPKRLQLYRETGLIRAIKNGIRYSYPLTELERFARDNLGRDLGTEDKIKKKSAYF